MGAPEPRTGGLADAQRDIAGLLGELEQTLDLVNRLADAGENEAALRLLDEQRASLYRVVDEISHDVGRKRSFAEAMRRNLGAVAAAAALVVASVAGTVASLTNDDPVREASAEISHASTLPDVRERLVVLVRVYERTRTLPAAQAEAVEDDLRQALGETLGEASEEDADDPLVGQAQQAFDDLGEGKPPPPPSAPGSEKGPIETVEDMIPDP